MGAVRISLGAGWVEQLVETVGGCIAGILRGIVVCRLVCFLVVLAGGQLEDDKWTEACCT